MVKYLKRSANIILCLISLNLIACSRNNLKPGEIPNPPETVESTKVVGSINAVASRAQEEGSDLVKSGARYDRVKKIMDRISTAAGMGNYPYPVFVAVNEDPSTANAFIYNGNTVVVYSQLIDKVSSDHELAAIMAHETGHMLGKHHEDDGANDRAENVGIFSKILGYTAAIVVAGVTRSSSLGRMAGNTTYKGSAYVGNGAFVKAYSRDKEREADMIGLVLMAKAGYNPKAAINFWKKADEVFPKSDRSVFQSTHPSHEDRASELEEHLEVAMQHYKPKNKGEAVASAK